MVGCICVCVCGGVLVGLLPWPIKWGFAFDSVLKETDEPAELRDFSPYVSLLVYTSLPQFLSETHSFQFKRL